MAMMVATMMLGCGADDDATSPSVPEPEGVCPPVETLMPTTFQYLESGQLPGLRTFFGERLSETQTGLLIDLLLDAVEGVDASEFSALAQLSRDPRIQGLTDGLVFALDFLLGQESGVLRSGFVEALRSTTSTCGGQTLFVALQETMNAPETAQVLETFGQVLAENPLGDALDLAGRPAFTALLCNVSARMMHPDFTVANDVIMPLRNSGLLPVDEPPLSSFLRALGILLGPDRLLLPTLGDLVCCSVYGAVTCAALPTEPTPLREDSVFAWTFYDFLVASIAHGGSFFDDLGALVNDPQTSADLAPLRRFLDTLATSPELRTTLVSVLKVLLEPETFEGVIRDVQRLMEEGALAEIINVLDALASGCQTEALRP